MQIKRVLKGSKIFDVKKSRKSKQVLFNILKPLKIPKDKLAGILISAIKIDRITTDFFLEILKLSIKHATDVSIKLIPDVIAAKNSKKKNKSAQGIAHGIFLKISGSEINTREAPAEGSIP